MPRTKVGIREFRANLASILESQTPVMVTRHGETLGVFVPVGAGAKPAKLRRSTKPTRTEIEAVRRAGAKMDTIVAAMAATEEELIDFEKARREACALRTRT